MNKSLKLPKKLTEKLAQDLAELMKNHEGALLALQLLESMPDEVKISLIVNLSMVHTPEVARFLLLIAREYSGEKVGSVAERSVKKLKLAGVPETNADLSEINSNRDNFFQALVSKTRLKGIVNLVLMFENSELPGNYDAYFFSLSFDEAGIKEFFFARDLGMEQVTVFLKDDSYIQITYAKALAILQMAFEYNLEFETLPALGIFIYDDLLKQSGAALPATESDDIYSFLTGELTPRQLVNGFCLALRREDHQLTDFLAAANQVIIQETGYLLANKIIDQKQDNSSVLTEIVVEQEDGLCRLTWDFKFTYREERLILTGIEEVATVPVDWSWLEEALSLNNQTAAYYILQPHAVRVFIESLEGIELFQHNGEMDFYKWWDLDLVLEKGVSFQDAVLADFIIGEDELVVITSDQAKLEYVQDLLETNLAYEMEMLDNDSVEVVYRIFDQDKMSFNQLIDQWMLTGLNPKEQLATWLSTKLVELNGMTPLEASDSSEGAKLLWALVKKIYKLGKGNSLVDYRTLLKAVGWGKKAGKNITKSRYK